jgi:hypothetical protein
VRGPYPRPLLLENVALLLSKLLKIVLQEGPRLKGCVPSPLKPAVLDNIPILSVIFSSLPTQLSDTVKLDDA